MAEVVYFATQHISSKINEGSNAITIVKSEVNALLSELNNVNKLLVEAEGRTGLSTSHEIQSCIAELKKIACEAEDAVDTLESDSTTLRLIYFGLCPGRASRKLKEIRERTREVKTLLNQHAEGSTNEAISPARRSQSPKSHLPADDDFVIGIDRDITMVVDQLTGESYKKLAIVGMGGCGKTTLARSLYNSKAVMKQFDFQAWVSVSQGLETSTMLADILTQVESQRSRFSWRKKDEEHETEPNTLLSRLNYVLYGRKCLLVLDDVWDLQSLHKFIALIQGDDPSHDYGYDYDYRAYKILITSRQSPLNRKSWYIHKPQCLTYENSWNLFNLVASNNSPKGLSAEYRPLAMEMLKKCQGLPLAIVALGRLLKTKDTMREWQKVLSQVTGSQATSMYGPVNEILGLSYDQLPYYLKPCFLYLGLFPEGPAISAGTLIRMWIAEGFVECENEETIEVAGRRYLQELIDHTMVHVVTKTYTGKAKLIRIHDIMRDYCVLKARELDFLAVSSFGNEAIGKSSRRAAINLRYEIIFSDFIWYDMIMFALKPAKYNIFATGNLVYVEIFRLTPCQRANISRFKFIIEPSPS
ncbi:putative disease resistance protein RF45 [Silene latifolia]|uniref:putative disease resistance protein RF45 n=1 Tax=Silene latifolia TaxID=37657 RepID=UPI003D7888AB